ncbi:restriction endonuclease [Micromonospora sp. NPDC005172]|uniref:restriction endonuclease n=1 Tax=Micromonospora sp. NPDC005172 TaxID=3156867 RepID=UPI0033B6BB69
MSNVEVTTYTDDEKIEELCRLYWAQGADNEFLHTVKELAGNFGIAAHLVLKQVNANSLAIAVSKVCPRCGSGSLVRSRSDLALVMRSPARNCEACQGELARERAEALAVAEASRRMIIRDHWAVAEGDEVDPAELDLRGAFALAALLLNDEEADDGIVPALDERTELLGPTLAFSSKLVTELYEQGRIAIHPDSPIAAFQWDGETVPRRYYSSKARFYIAGSGPIEGRARAYLDKFDKIISVGAWPEHWLEELPRFWKELATAECSAYLVFCLNQHSLEFSPGDKTEAVLGRALEWFTLGQLFSFIWRAARDAAAYKARDRVSKSQAANSAITRLRTSTEKAYAEGWTVPSYKRDSRLAVSTLSHLLLTRALKMPDQLAFNPLLTEGRSAVRLKWDKLDAEGFERLIFSLVSAADGYIDVDWLMNTNAPDHGRDLGATRIRHDALTTQVRERIVIQCKHWLSRSIKDDDMYKEVASVEHWDNPPVDVLIMATSGRFTAGGVSWIERHNAKGVRPRIEMWNDARLEMLLAERPHLILDFELR